MSPREPLPLASLRSLSRAEVREIDRRAIGEYGMPGVVLMENAGRGAAETLARLPPRAGSVLILCGKGNNGGDGFVMARHLEVLGLEVQVQLWTQDEDLAADAACHYEILRRAGPRPERIDPRDSGAVTAALARVGHERGWIVDALFGTGLTGAPRPPFDRLIEAINAANARVLAVDLPSGLDCDTGEPLGPTVRADHTVTFVAPKRGFSQPAARPWIGRVHVVGIGVPRVLLIPFQRTADPAGGH